MEEEKVKKTFSNTSFESATKNVMDMKVWGTECPFKLISKAWSEEEGWMKSTKALQINKVGCIVQVTTQQGNNVSEAVVYIPNVKIKEIFDDKGVLIGRELVSMIEKDANS